MTVCLRVSFLKICSVLAAPCLLKIHCFHITLYLSFNACLLGLRFNISQNIVYEGFENSYVIKIVRTEIRARMCSNIKSIWFGVQIYLILEEVFNDVVLAFSGFQLFACVSCDTSFFRFFSSNKSFRCLLLIMLCDLFYLSFLQYHSFFDNAVWLILPFFSTVSLFFPQDF